MEMLLETGRDVEHLRVRLSEIDSHHLLAEAVDPVRQR
jgi:hypothetical protein